ncbi:RtcB family protein [Pseudomonas cavernicola]|uniref:3'-phosphate/5'-hydroxy nucleic acid ligase n=1 Tax=Pseudomonas cavernicola TaxID=2320866 RepID=A0A418XCH1_9PSED|nr:RtcB family protein [Pseudomonas cavernicola]RJG10191.1 RtcB family protein [Pseudomonas cavernicola]
MSAPLYQRLEVPGGKPIVLWTQDLPVEPQALQQLQNTARMPFIHGHLAVMPDVHLGKGSTIGSVIPSKGAIIPAAVGVDIGCGMVAARTSLNARDLPDNLAGIRHAIEEAIPHGKSFGRHDVGAWQDAPHLVDDSWRLLASRFAQITAKYPHLAKTNNRLHLGTLGGGNHFIEVCLDEADRVWMMLHSGSRGVGNAIGRCFIELAKEDMGKALGNLPDADLAYLKEGSKHFDDYVQAVEWAQDYALSNRTLMMRLLVEAVRHELRRPFEAQLEAVNCHHNYVSREFHFGEELLITRKGALSAKAGELGIIPGSMGAQSFIVRGKGNPESFCSCSHGAGRLMSRHEAKRRFTLADHQRATAGVECRKDQAVIDETPGAYKPIEKVMAAQADLVEIVHSLKQIVCVKG